MRSAFHVLILIMDSTHATLSAVLARFTCTRSHAWPEQQRPWRSTLREPSQTSSAPLPLEGSAEQRWAWHLHHGYLRSLLQMATIWSHGPTSQTQQRGRWELLSFAWKWSWVSLLDNGDFKKRKYPLADSIRWNCTEEACKRFLVG